MKSYIKGTFTPLGDVKITVVDPTKEAITYRDNSILLSSETGEITAIRHQEITDEEYAYLLDIENKLPRNEQFEGYLNAQCEAVKTILGYIQAFNGVFKLDTELRVRSPFRLVACT
jgi:hypothetical protein